MRRARLAGAGVRRRQVPPVVEAVVGEVRHRRRGVREVVEGAAVHRPLHPAVLEEEVVEAAQRKTRQSWAAAAVAAAARLLHLLVCSAAAAVCSLRLRVEAAAEAVALASFPHRLARVAVQVAEPFSQ